MIEQFRDLEDKFNDVERRMSDPEIISDQAKYRELVKKHAELKHGVELYQSYTKVTKELNDAKELLKDPDMKDMAEEEIESLSEKQQELYDDMQIFLIPKDPNDNKNAIIEIRQGTGGEEAALFAERLYRMYTKFAESKGWKVDILSENFTDMGGIKEISFLVAGENVYGHLKYESGTHRVQRVPETESAGRIHTSAATVAIMPEAEEVDITIDTKDLRVDTFRASGAGGQHVNKTSSAIRITHIPTGIVVACQDERSQFQNKDKAMIMLRTKLYDAAEEKRRATESSLRKNQVGSGDRSEKIRTYNFPQNRVTDHRINLTLYNMLNVLDGDLTEVVEGLMKADRLAKMKQ